MVAEGLAAPGRADKARKFGGSSHSVRRNDLVQTWPLLSSGAPIARLADYDKCRSRLPQLQL